jgi:hypothetical protein
MEDTSDIGIFDELTKPEEHLQYFANLYNIATDI